MIRPETLSRTKVADLRKLLQKKYRTERGRFLVEGIRSVEEVLESDWPVEVVVMTEYLAADHPPLVQRIRSRRVPLYSVSRQDLERISDTTHSQGILAVVEQKSLPTNFLEGLVPGSMVVVADEVSEPGNLGTVIRTCDWFGASAVVVSEGSAEVFNPKVVRSTMGSLFHVPVVWDAHTQNTLDMLRRRKYRVYATSSAKGTDIQQTAWSDRSVLVFGNEAHGLSSATSHYADEFVRIPRFGRAESLNVGIACGIALASWRLTCKLHS